MTIQEQYELLEKTIRGYNPSADFDQIRAAFDYAIDRSQEVETLESIESTHIHKVVDQCHGNISRAAELLGITRQTLYAKLKR